MEQIIQYKHVPMRVAKKLIELAVKHSIEMGEKDEINFVALNKALKETNLEIIISEEDLNKWQDPYYQIKLVRGL